ncbi:MULTISPECIES: hypothetical protein [Pseudonocardia]|uniref:Uncharacterized protein n=2 Tax=Pseudonocardia TaxID=1847 RepID=A0A1Y2N250_PSEAH|nr:MULTISPECIES: hypothetical protein [Pseudonocardia]OSY41281.1 hypothetical protein BG845_02183 [Pseudonocardia autotrophica]TDN76736.1 hypothetical protein C8E95_5953 [Pseudonocardia autotrophica]
MTTPARTFSRIAAGAAALALGGGLLLTPAIATAAEPPPNIDDGRDHGLIPLPPRQAPEPGSDSGEAQFQDVVGPALDACSARYPVCTPASGAWDVMTGAYP